MSETMRPRGRLVLTVRGPEGEVARREATNLVLRRGASVIARLFSGAAGSQPVNRVMVGFGREAGTAELTALTPPEGGAVPAAALATALAPASFKIAADRPGAVRVAVEAVFRPTVDLEGVTEAGLLAGDDLYNQVVFEPVNLRVGQDVTFFWEVDFPFGH